MKKIIMPASDSNSPLKKKKRRRCLRFERNIALCTQKKKRKYKELIAILTPIIRRVVRKELQRQSPPSVPRSPVNQIQDSNVISLQLHFKNPLPQTLYTNSTDISVEVVIRVGEENVVTGPLSSISVKLMVLSGDFEKEDWTKEEFEEKVVSPRKGKGPLLMGKEVIALKGGVGTFNDIKITDNSSWTSSGRFRLGVKAVQGMCNSVKEIILEARSEAFVVRDQRGESSQKRDCPLLKDKIWRLKNIRINGVYFGNLKGKGINTVQEFLQAYNLDAPSLQEDIGMKNRKWNETLTHAKKCEKGDEYFMYSKRESNTGLLFNSIYEIIAVTFDGCQSFQFLDHLHPPEKNLVENLKEQANQDREGIIKYNGLPSFTPTSTRLPQLHEVASIEAAPLYRPNANVIIHRNELATTNYMHHSIQPPLSDVMINQPQHGSTRLFGQMHCNNFSLIGDSPVQQQDTLFSQNLQSSQAFIFNNQNNTFSASNVSDNLHGDYVPTTMATSHENFSNIMD